MTSSRLCLHCMSGYVKDGVCQRCGQADSDRNRIAAALPYGYSLGQYRLGEVLGQGGFGITYHAWDMGVGRPAAVKEFFPVGCVSRERNGTLRVVPEKAQYFQHVRQRFQEEAQLIYSLRNHPEIFQIYSLFASHGTVCYAMEYLKGENLDGLLRREGHLEWEDLKDAVWGALLCLRVLHEHHLIHRDISPDNIFLLSNGACKLIDFGSVRNFRTSDHFTGIFKGSLAPLEMYNEDATREPRQGTWTDIFSLSATIYYLLSGGVLPTHVYDRLASVKMNGRDSLTPLSDYSPQTPAYILTALRQGMELNPSDRLADVDAFRKAFFPERSFLSVTQPVQSNAFSVQTSERTTTNIRVFCTAGSLKGNAYSLPIGKVVTLGRDAENTGNRNDISYPSHTQGVSRRQCAFYRDQRDGLYVMDIGSTYGTFLDGRKLNPNAWVCVSAEQTVSFGREEFRFLK